MRGVLKETHFALSGCRHHSTDRFKPSWFERSATTPRGTLDATAPVAMSLNLIVWRTYRVTLHIESSLQGESNLPRGVYQDSYALPVALARH